MGNIFTRNFRNDHYEEIREKDFLGARAILTDDYKLVIDGGKGTGAELFDLKKDSGEKNNIAVENPDVVEKLTKQLRGWQESVLNSLMGKDYK
jgi:arylsulfatase A-like enzyme